MKKVIYGFYSAEGDITFIMEDAFNEEGLLVSQAVVGFYYGKQAEEFNRQFMGSTSIVHDEPQESDLTLEQYGEGSFIVPPQK